MARRWYDIRAKADAAAEISIHDEIGYFGVRAADFIRDLKALGDVRAIDLHINSPGGEVFDALAIHNALQRHPATVTGHVDGLAASAASVVAMAGDRLVMPENAMLMIHNPWGAVIGDADEMREFADVLDKITGSLVSVYRGKTGLEDDEIAQLMRDETWMTAAEAVELGFADEVAQPVKAAARFDLSRYRNPPRALSKRRPSAARTTGSGKETQMSDATLQPAEEVTNAGSEQPPEAVTTAPAEPEPQPEAKARREAAAIVALVEQAGRICADIKPARAADFIAAGHAPEQVRAALWEEIVAKAPAISSHVMPDTTTTADAGWDRAVATVNRRI